MVEYITLGILILGVIGGIAKAIWGKPKSTDDLCDDIRAIMESVEGVSKSQSLLLDKVEWIESQMQAQWRRIEGHDKELKEIGKDIVKMQTICKERERPVVCRDRRAQ